MTMPQSSPEQSGVPVENVQDIIPPSERNEDAAVTEETNDLTLGGPRPLTAKERKASDRDTPVHEPVYAPASERVAVDPLPGHRDFVAHTDTHTPERQSVGHTHTQPSFGSNSGTYNDMDWNSQAKSRALPIGIGLGWVLLGVGGLGGWLFLRWRNERNKPINRIRRQAMQAAVELRDHVPSSPEEVVKPAAGLTTALISIMIILWQQAQARSRQADQVVSKQSKKVAKRADKAVGRADKVVRGAAEAVSDADWQKQLTMLKKRWNPSRLELEKMSISRH